jgi:hypothetical protein
LYADDELEMGERKAPAGKGNNTKLDTRSLLQNGAGSVAVTPSQGWVLRNSLEGGSPLILLNRGDVLVVVPADRVRAGLDLIGKVRSA